LPLEELPRLLADLEEVRVTAMARLTAPIHAQHPPDELVAVDEAACLLGVSPNYLYHNHKRLTFVRRMGRRLLFSSNGIQAYLRSRR
jgi:hypothetical protein